MKEQPLLKAYTLVVLLAAMMVATAVLGGNGGAFSDGDLLPPSLAVDRIAYVDAERRIRTVSPDGMDDMPVSPEVDESFAWPTWSPDGLRLAFSGARGEGADYRSVLYARNTVTGGLRELHMSEPGVLRLVARDAPHYIYWSPDGNVLAFIGSSSSGLKLYLDDIRDDVAPAHMLSDGPLWSGWAPDSRRLLVHRGLDHFMIGVDKAKAELLPVYSDQFAYRVPSWKPSGDKITVTLGDSYVGYTLYLSDAFGLTTAPLMAVPSNTAFLWSQDGQWLATARPRAFRPFDPDMQLAVYDGISVVGPDGSAKGPEIAGDVVAFFWSPDSTKLAYVTVTETPGVLRLNVYDFFHRTEQRLVDFLPSSDQLVVFRYFDQYAPSHSQWSPGSGALVFVGRLAGTSVSAAFGQQQPDRVFVVSLPPKLTVDAVAEGSLAFWSPR